MIPGSLLMVLILAVNPARQTQPAPGEGPIQSVTIAPGYMGIAITMEAPPPNGLLTEIDSAVLPTKAAAVNDLVAKLRALGHKWPELDAVMLSVYDVEAQGYRRWERHGVTYEEV